MQCVQLKFSLSLGYIWPYWVYALQLNIPQLLNIVMTILQLLNIVTAMHVY